MRKTFGRESFRDEAQTPAIVKINRTKWHSIEIWREREMGAGEILPDTKRLATAERLLEEA